jgi:hypothetical protein
VGAPDFLGFAFPITRDHVAITAITAIACAPSCPLWLTAFVNLSVNDACTPHPHPATPKTKHLRSVTPE